jgi:hypothetical protein
VWRERVHLGDDRRLVVNVSVWTSYAALHQYTYRSAHNHFIRRQRQWFDRVTQPSTVLWWVPADTRPTVADALTRLRHLHAYGPEPSAFSLRVRFDPDGHRELSPREAATRLPG